MKNALVLGGGANKGCFEAGAIAAAFHQGFVPDAIYGVSVGSLNALFLTERAGRAKRTGQPVDWPAIGEQLVEFWISEVTGLSAFAAKRKWYSVLWGILWNKFQGLLDTSPLEKLVAKQFDIENVRASATGFTAGVVNVWDTTYSDIQKDDPEILTYSLASSSIPVEMPGHIIGGKPFFDGGVRRIAPLKKSIEDGASKIVAIACQPRSMPANDVNIRNPLDLLERSTDIMENEIINSDIDYAVQINESLKASTAAGHQFQPGHILHGKRVLDLIVLRPDEDLAISLTDFTTADVKRLIDIGRQIAGRDYH